MFWIWLIYRVLNLVVCVCVCVCYRQRHVLQQKEQPEQRQGVFVWRSLSLKGNKKKEEMLVLIEIYLLFKYFATKHNKTLTKGDKFQLA